MKLHYQSVISSKNLMRKILDYPDPVWYAPDGIANVLSLSKVEKHYKVTFNSTGPNVFTVHGNQCNSNFKESESGLHCLDTVVKNEISLVTTVKYTRGQ